MNKEIKKMNHISEILEKVNFHDSSFVSMTVNCDESVDLILDIEQHWNEELDPNINCVRFKRVYEILNFRTPILSISGADFEEIHGYVDLDKVKLENVIKVTFGTCYGENIVIICSGDAELLHVEYPKSKYFSP